MKNKTVFLDRDGVINEMVYNTEFGTIDCRLNLKEFKLEDYGVVDGRIVDEN